jgi:hypothetical protein
MASAALAASLAGECEAHAMREHRAVEPRMVRIVLIVA